jgi:ATP-binding cassette subfamily F protein 3
MEPANLLLLDEPTHHLDLAGKEVLEDALDQFRGAILVVTHDRSLMARLATRVVEVNDGRVMLYPGGYEDYEAARLARVAAADGGDGAVVRGAAGGASTQVLTAPPGARPRVPDRTEPGAGPVTPAAANAAPREGPGARAERRKREREIRRIEKDIEIREMRVRELETLLADPEVYHDGARARSLVTEYEHLRAEVDSLWQRLAEL